MDLLNECDKAYERIKKDIYRTPLLYSHWLSDACNGRVYLKLESEQITGSFKARGSLNKLRWMQEQEIKALPVTASTGNHGLGFAWACDLLEMDAKVYLPNNAAEPKVDAIQRYDIEIQFYGNGPFETEQYLREKAHKKGWAYISPYNDPQIIGGQGTIAMEVLDKLPAPDHILTTVGGGGLISGIGTVAKENSPGSRLIGCQPVNSPEMSASVQAGKYQQIESKPTLSAGSAGGFEPAAITFDCCRRLVDDFILTSEHEIAEAIRLTAKHHHKIIEGAAGVAIASLLKDPSRFSKQTTVIVVCGANISLKKLRNLL